MNNNFATHTGAPHHHILVVDDDPMIAALLEEHLKAEGYTVSLAANGRKMMDSLTQSPPDLVILDLMLGKENALPYARELRERFGMGVIILSGRGDLADKVVGLEMGADDYMTKPFEIRELLARLRSVLRRTQSAEAETPAKVACFAGWQLDLANYVLVSPQGKEVPITSHEFRALSAFVKHAPRVLSRDDLMDSLYTNQTLYPFDRRIDVLVMKLRRKLREPEGRPRLIKTMRGAGYALATEVSYQSALSPPSQSQQPGELRLARSA